MSLKHKHNLDSQVANSICATLHWCIPMHDAFTINPNDASKTRALYTDKLMEIYKNRKSILKNYLASIGIDKSYKEMDTDEVTSFMPYCLK